MWITLYKCCYNVSVLDSVTSTEWSSKDWFPAFAGMTLREVEDDIVGSLGITLEKIAFVGNWPACSL